MRTFISIRALFLETYPIVSRILFEGTGFELIMFLHNPKSPVLHIVLFGKLPVHNASSFTFHDRYVLRCDYFTSYGYLLCVQILLLINLHIPVDFSLSQNIPFWEPKRGFVEGD